MKDYTKILPEHIEKYVGDWDLFLEIYNKEEVLKKTVKRPPLLFLHGAYSGSWMWSRYLPHFAAEGWNCYAMNLRGHYKSRSADLTRVSFDDYLEDIKNVLDEIGEAPILIGHSMGGILGQKLAETASLAGLVLMDTSICREVFEMFPYSEIREISSDIIIPAPYREAYSLDETTEIVDFQKKYLSMESSKAIRAFADLTEGRKGISVNHALVTCPCLIISAISSEEDDLRSRAMAEYFNAEYTGLWGTTHTGLLVGQRYEEAVDRILTWLRTLPC